MTSTVETNVTTLPVRTTMELLVAKFTDPDLDAKLEEVLQNEEVKKAIKALEERAEQIEIKTNGEISKKIFLESCLMRENIIGNVICEAFIRATIEKDSWDLKKLMLDSFSIKKTIMIINGIGENAEKEVMKQQLMESLDLVEIIGAALGIDGLISGDDDEY